MDSTRIKKAVNEGINLRAWSLEGRLGYDRISIRHAL